MVAARRRDSDSPPDGELDAATLLEAQQGEEAARRALVLRYQAPVFALLHRFLGNRSGDVEDIAQETFLRVFRALPTFRPGGRARLSTWILTVAMRLAIDTRRRSLVRQLHVPERPASPAWPDRIAQRKALGATVAREVASLPDPFRAAFVLRAYHDLGYREIAEALDCDVGTAKSRVARAKQRLREALSEHTDGE